MVVQSDIRTEGHFTHLTAVSEHVGEVLGFTMISNISGRAV